MWSASVWEERDRATAVAWERFVAGGDVRYDVRPEILLSWHRCRDEYKIDPRQSQAPSADDYCEHSLKSDRVVTELGSVGRSLLEEVAGLGGLMAITDGTGRILATLGDRGALRHGERSNLAPWSAWSERAIGTNGMGTALESPKGAHVRCYEHWCQGLHGWSCAATSIRDPATGDPLAVLDLSLWKKPLPGDILPWLRKAVQGIEVELREQARRDVSDLREALERMDCLAPKRPLIALNNGGGVVAANGKAGPFVEMFCSPATLNVPTPGDLVQQAVSRARANHSWVGFAEFLVPSSDDLVSFTTRPVVKNNRVVGIVGIIGESEGERIALNASSPPRSPFHRVAAVQGNELVLLRSEEIVFAEVERNTVWLTTDHGRLRARMRGLQQLEKELRDKHFVRVHRCFIVNSSRVTGIKYGFRGQLSLVMDHKLRKTVPVSRRRGAAVRAALEL